MVLRRNVAATVSDCQFVGVIACLCNKDSIAEVPCDVSLGPREINLIHPRVEPRKIIVAQRPGHAKGSVLALPVQAHVI